MNEPIIVIALATKKGNDRNETIQAIIIANEINRIGIKICSIVFFSLRKFLKRIINS
jgi:hypothetical protein